MEVTPKQHITGSLITDSTTTLFTASEVSIITQWWLASTHSADVTVELWVVPALGSAGDSNVRLHDVTVSPTLPTVFDVREVLQVGDTVQAKASVTNKVALSAAGWEEV